MDDGALPNPLWKRIWKNQSTQRTRVFLWSLAHNSIMTDNKRLRVGLVDSDVCKRCGSCSETSLHALRDCNVVKPLWQKLSAKLNSSRGILYHESFVTWKPPMEGWIKVNMDGSYNHCTKKMSCGAVIRNDKGDWLMGLAKPMGSGSALQAEICGIILGLEMAWKYGMKKETMETDSTEALDFAQDLYDKNHPLRYLAEKIKEYKDRNWQVVFKHTFRETNRVAYFLAKYARNRSCEDCFLTSPPDECIELVKNDAQGLGFWRV
ncbi:ribonuclease H [Senna tora]|uniref:Ribonuclease H n=1 Tax=Senna tora TaxID=362788 RepID=A0A834SM27_9FABA|nr:ribonuclease H [Senna tora]